MDLVEHVSSPGEQINWPCNGWSQQCLLLSIIAIDHGITVVMTCISRRGPSLNRALASAKLQTVRGLTGKEIMTESIQEYLGTLCKRERARLV